MANPIDLKSGKVSIGGVRLNRVLSEKNKWSIIYEGWHPEVGDVAIKIANPSLKRRDEIEAANYMISNEREILGKLGPNPHPNILGMVGFGNTREAQKDGKKIDLGFVILWNASRLVKAVPRDNFRNRFYTAQRIIEIGEDIVLALEYLHGNEVVHGDVNPNNCLLDEKTGRIKICDFGIAVSAPELGDTRWKHPGTPGYMSPEQATGGFVRYESDAWSSGATLYKLATGEDPVEGSSEIEKFENVKRGNVRAYRVPIKRSDLPKDFGYIVRSMMEPNPDKRREAWQLAGCFSELKKELAKLPGT